MHPLVRDLFKRIVLLKQDHYDPPYLINAAKKVIKQHKDITDEKELRKAIAYGRWMLREEQGRVRFHRYRALRSRYVDTEEAAAYRAGAGGSTYNEEAELKKLDRGDE